MSVIQRHSVSFEQDAVGAALRRAGRIAGALAIAAFVFASLYFFMLYLASN